MNSRERVASALDHKQGDRIPVDFWATDTVISNLETHLGIPYVDVLDRYDVDLRYIDGPAYIGPPLAEHTDIWGVSRRSVAATTTTRSESYSEVVLPPLADATSVEAINNYLHWPDPDWFDYSVIEAQCDTILSRNRVVAFMGDRLNRVAQLKPAMYLRGSENILVDIVAHEDVARAIFDRIKQFYLVYLDRILRAANGKIDIVVTGDDFGAQNGLLVSPDTWRTYLQPGFEQYLSLIKRHGTTTMHHTCGSVVDIIPDMIESGLDILQSIQPEATGMDISSLKEAFGSRLCFHGGVSIQKTMPYGSPDDVRREVARIAETVGSDGGFIFCTSHNIQADTPDKNIVALLEAYMEHTTVMAAL